MNPVWSLLYVPVTQALLLAWLPWWALRGRCWPDRNEHLLAALLMGLASAALSGWVFNAVGLGVVGGFGVWLGGWVLAGVLGWRHRLAGPTGRWDTILGLILLLALVVRLMHPLQVWSLGQSDAYSHLDFMMRVLERGRVGHPHYPPAFAWVMSFPALAWPGHPYWVARFGGAFFGAGLTLAVYGLLRRWEGPVAARVGAALLAGCPVFWLLQKTGVGVYANQLGLFLLVAGLWAYSANRWFWLVLAIIALAAAVPMMLPGALLLLGWWVVVDRPRMGVLLGMVALAGGAALCVVLLFAQLPAREGAVIARMLTGTSAGVMPNEAPWIDVFGLLARDFFAVKRMGYPSVGLNVVALSSVVVFIGAFWFGWRRQRSGWARVGLWGSWTGVGLYTGLFQFTTYQREGWSFLLACVCLSGLVADALWHHGLRATWRRAFVVMIVVASMVGLALPPVHPVDDVDEEVIPYLLALDPEVTLLARPRTGFQLGQGDLVRTLHPKTLLRVEQALVTEGLVYFLRDYPAPSPPVSRIMKWLQPGLTSVIEQEQQRAESDNLLIEEAIADRVVRVERVAPHLAVWVLHQADSEGSDDE